MKYKKITEEILEDKEILDSRPLQEISRKTGIKLSTLSLTKHGKRIPTETWYLHLKKLLGI